MSAPLTTRTNGVCNRGGFCCCCCCSWDGSQTCARSARNTDLSLTVGFQVLVHADPCLQVLLVGEERVDVVGKGFLLPHSILLLFVLFDVEEDAHT